MIARLGGLCEARSRSTPCGAIRPGVDSWAGEPILTLESIAVELAIDEAYVGPIVA